MRERPSKDQILMLSAIRLSQGKTVSTAWLRQTYGLPKASAVRYMDHLEACLPLVDVGQTYKRELAWMT